MCKLCSALRRCFHQLFTASVSVTPSAKGREASWVIDVSLHCSQVDIWESEQLSPFPITLENEWHMLAPNRNRPENMFGARARHICLVLDTAPHALRLRERPDKLRCCCCVSIVESSMASLLPSAHTTTAPPHLVFPSDLHHASAQRRCIPLTAVGRQTLLLFLQPV
jgi:hypothetical protein